MNTNNLLQAVIEGFVDGILIVTSQGKLVCTNDCAREICSQFHQEQSVQHNQPVTNWIPSQIWHSCKTLIDNQEEFPDHFVVLEDEVHTRHAHQIRVRVQWMELDAADDPCLLITLEDKFQSAKRMAIAERQRYGLTAREFEVWLLRRADYTYKEIAAQLFIAVDTVKKHMKSIHAKQQAFQWANE